MLSNPFLWLLSTALILSCKNEKNTQEIKAGNFTQTENNNEEIIEKDSIVIPVNKYDTLAFSATEFKNILHCYPELDSNRVIHPDFTYAKARVKFGYLDSLLRDKCSSFSSELGQDTYYVLYAYFLQKRQSDKKFEKPRKTIIEIYETINLVFAKLNRGGTGFGHLNRRIRGYAEFSIYCLKGYETERVKEYDIAKQRDLYISLLNQRIEDEIQYGDIIVGNQEQLKEKKELFKMTEKLKSLISNSFYLNEAIEFQYSHY